MEVDLDIVLQNLNATATDERKFGINKFLEAVKNFYQFDINETNSNNLRILFLNQIKVTNLFSTIGRLLRDPDWKIRKDTFEVLITIIIKDILKEKLDFYIVSIIRHVIKCLSDSMMTVRKSATQFLHEYLNKTNDFEKFIRLFIDYGLHNNLDVTQRRDNNQALQVILTLNFASYNYSELIIGVLNQMNCECPDENKIQGIVVDVLKSIRKLVGEDRFSKYIRDLPTNVLLLFDRCSIFLEPQSQTSSMSTWKGVGIENENGKYSTSFVLANPFQTKKFPSLGGASSNEFLYFGFIPQSVIDDINNDRKLEAIEEVYNLFKINFVRDMPNILPHLAELLQFIQKLMEDKYLVIMTAFKLLIDLMCCIPLNTVSMHLDGFLQLLRVALLYNLNSDAILQKYIMSYSMVLFQKADTDQLVAKLCDSQFMMDPKQASIRQVSIDIIISALLQFPSTKFNLDFLCGKVSQRLLDKKQKVKQAALECISVIAYNYGNGKTNTLLKTVEQATKSDLSINVLELVQARLSKHRLPHIDDLGIVVYMSDNNDKLPSQRQQSIMDLENSSSENSPISSANLDTRRPSAGKVRGRAKFPWDQNETSSGHSSASNTFRNNYEQAFKQNQDNPNFGSFSTVTPRNVPHQNLKLNEDNAIENSPFPTKPALGRSDRSDSKVNNSAIINGDKSANALLNFTENPNDILNSSLLQGVRNSASKKKALKIFNSSMSSNSLDQESKSQYPPTKPVKDQQIDNNNNVSHKNNEVPIVSNMPKETFHKINSDHPTVIMGKSQIESKDVPPVSRKQPIKGIHHSFSLAHVMDYTSRDFDKVTMKNPNTNLFVKSSVSDNLPYDNGHERSSHTAGHLTTDASFPIGDGENDGLFSKISVGTTHQNVMHQKVASETSLSPLYFSVNYVNNEDNYFNPLSSRLEFNVIGKSMLENSGVNVNRRNLGNNNSFKRQSINIHPDSLPLSQQNSSRNSDQSTIDLNSGIVGIGLADKLNVDDESDEEPNRGIISNTLRESLSLKRQKVTNELHSYKPENSTNSASSYSAPENKSHQASYHKPPTGGGYYNGNNLPSSAGNEREITNGYEGVPPSLKALLPVLGNSTPKKIKPFTQVMSNTQSNSDTVSVMPAILSNPEKSINECMNLIQNEDWEKKISAMIIIQSLVQFHSDTLIAHSPDIHAICIALCKECKNLRSQVAKCAIQTVGQLFIHLRKHMDQHLDNVVSNLLSKAGEGTNSFLKQDVEYTLALMIENVSSNRSILALLQNGAIHKNTTVRRLAAYNVSLLCEKLGSAKTMSCVKEVPDKILPGILKFAIDGNQETRYYGKKILFELNKQPDFEKLCNKHIPTKDLRILKEILDNIKIKGIGDSPPFSHSAGMQRTGSLSRDASATNLVNMSSKVSSLSRGSSRSMTRLPGPEMSDDDKDWLANTCAQLSSPDFRNRQIGLDAVLKKAELNGLDLPQKSIFKMLKEFIPRLNDNNTKVTVTALNVCHKIIPCISSIFPPEFLSEFINTISLNFASKSFELKEAATNLMNVCFTNLDHSFLIQPCIEAINKSNTKTKPIVIDNMNDLLSHIEKSKPPSLNRSIGMIIRHIIPEIGLLLEKNKPLTPQLKESVHNLVGLTYQIVGQEMIDSVAQRGDHALKQAIIDILNLKNINAIQ